MAKKRSHAVWWVLGAVGVALGVIAARVASRTVEDDESIDDVGPERIPFTMNERRYPPFRDEGIEGIRIEGDGQAEQQAIVIGIERQEFETNNNQRQTRLALARCDMHALWRPAVASEGAMLTLLSEGNQEFYTCAMFVSPGLVHLTMGFISGEHFTPCPSTRIIALTTKEGLQYDYPNVPIAQVL